MWTDAHAHLCHPELLKEIGPLLQRASSVGVERIVNICTNPQEVEQGLELQRTYPHLFLAAATTPHDAATEGEAYFAQMEEYAKKGVLVAVGETGLDYHYYKESAGEQQNLLKRYARLAAQTDLPLILHCRDAFADLFAVLDEEALVKTVLHCFTGTQAEAHEVIKRGWWLSLSGIVTFKKSLELQQIAREMPLEKLLIETDAPYLAPAPHRGEPNEPSYLIHTGHFIASLRGLPPEVLASATTQNALAFFSF